MNLYQKMALKNKACNTYHLESAKPFRPCEIKRLVDELLEQTFSAEPFAPNALPGLAQRLATQLREKILEFDFQRYKFVVVVHTMDKMNQGVSIESRPLWDCERDNHVTATFQTKQLLAVATVFAVYYD
ncbi:Hypothetical predicted protein [Cloeon dipterum]|uniref:Dynein light chain n=1 Tax=Cloeon dipterum TaxID=197152 RepID=A0A8S1BXB1_9INSE|nr:Hypothetical predicted protein [Cloeon dipterum]CAB3377018.1 Hypothetical predicted protein [Cloeon dipterum]